MMGADTSPGATYLPHSAVRQPVPADLQVHESARAAAAHGAESRMRGGVNYQPTRLGSLMQASWRRHATAPLSTCLQRLAPYVVPPERCGNCMELGEEGRSIVVLRHCPPVVTLSEYLSIHQTTIHCPGSAGSSRRTVAFPWRRGGVALDSWTMDPPDCRRFGSWDLPSIVPTKRTRVRWAM